MQDSRIRRRCVAAASLLRFRDAELQRGDAGPCRHRRLRKQGAHVGVAFSGCALGVFSLDSARRTRQRRARKADGRLRRGGLSANSPVCDREGDMCSLLSEAAAPGGLLVRASRSGGPSRRTARSGTCSRPNWTSSRRRRSTCGGPRTRKGRNKLRTALGTAPLTMLAVRVLEKTPPTGRDRLNWLLLTTEGEPTQENAIRAWKRWLRVVRGRQDRNADQGAQRRRRPEEVPRLPLLHAPSCPSSASRGAHAGAHDRPRGRDPCPRRPHTEPPQATRPRRSRSSPSTPRASPDSSRASRAPTNSGAPGELAEGRGCKSPETKE